MKTILDGRTIKALLVGKWDGRAEGALYFVTDNGVVLWRVDGDCCSESWFADITGVHNLLGWEILSIHEVEMPAVVDGRTRQEVDRVYGYRITTDGGLADIVFRNSSNGYYGGDMAESEYVSSLPDGLKEISQDWSA
jgi:hypothetical protein